MTKTSFIHVLEKKQVIQADLETCWKFFSNPQNLSRITPSNLGFEVQSEVPEEIYPGLMITYRVRPLWNIPVTWLTEITHVNRLSYFADEQRVGPYSIWHHEHFFTEVAPGITEMRDLVHYRLPFVPLLEGLHLLVIKPQLRRIFDYRCQIVDHLFPK